MLGGSPPPGSYDATEAKYYKGLFKETPWNAVPAVTSAVAALILLFVFWPLAIVAIIATGFFTCAPQRPPQFRPGYAGRCPACNSTIRMEVKDTHTECKRCKKLVIKQEGKFRVLK